MTVDLDTRMRDARDSLRGAADHLSPGRPGRPPRSLRPAAVVAVAAAAVLVVVGVAVRPDHHERLSTVIAPPSSVPRLVPAHMPPGVLAPVAGELPFPSPPPMDPFGPASVTLFGDPRAGDPFAKADLAVAVTGRDPGSEVGGERVTVRGRTGSVIDIGTAPFISWQEQPGTAVLIGSRTLDRAQLLAAADALVVRGGRVTLRSVPAGLPGRLDRVAEVPNFPIDGLTEEVMPLMRYGATGHLVGNQSNGEEDPSFYVLTAEGNAQDLALMRWITHADTPTRIRGHLGWAGAQSTDPTVRGLVWQEAPGVVAVAVGTGVDQRAMQETVAGLHPASAREWHALLAAGDKSGLLGG
jgi:hypothetical protein